jgi:ketosteroid isomerase-like protein
MTTVLKVFLLIILALSFNALGQKTNGTLPKDAKNPTVECASALCEVERTEREYNEVFLAPTADLFDKLHTDDFYTTSENPARITVKASILYYLKNVGMRPGTLSSVNTSDLKVRVYGTTAVATGIWKTTAISTNNNEVNKTERFTRVWVKENDRWRLAASHYSTGIEPPTQQ